MRKIVWAVLMAALAGTMMLGGNAHGQAPPPPPPPPCPPSGCGTPTPTATPTATPSPTPLPLTLSVRLAHGTIAVRTRQTVSVTTTPKASVSITIRFPNGNVQKHSGTAGSNGKLTWSFTQLGSRITHASRTARVTVTARNGATAKSSTKRFVIGFAALDVSAEPRTQKRGGAVTIWVHTRAFTPVSINLQRVYTVQVRTAANGWSSSRVVVSSVAPKGRIAVVARAVIGGRPVSGVTSFQVR